MIKRTFILLLLLLFSLINTNTVFADALKGGADCDRTFPNGLCADGFSCQPAPNDSQKRYACRENIQGYRDCSLTDVNGNPAPNGFCASGLSCKPSPPKPSKYLCLPSEASDAFGKIQAPDALKGFLEKNPTGSGAISQFLSNGITLFYSIAGIVLIFMLLWGAFQWLTSGGDKEQLAAAQKRIMNAIIGILLFALAFAIVQVLGRFTGFTFFVGQK